MFRLHILFLVVGVTVFPAAAKNAPAANPAANPATNHDLLSQSSGRNRTNASTDAKPAPAGNQTDSDPVTQHASPEAREALNRGQELLLEKHDARGSIEYFRKAVSADPGFAPGFLLLGAAYMQTGAFKEAQAAFESAAKDDPGNASAFIGIGAALNEQRRWAEAQKPLRRGLDLKPDSAEAHYEMARGLCALNNWQAAEPHAAQAIALNSSYAGPHVLMGNIYLRNGNGVGALAEYREYLRLAPQGDQAAEVKKIVARIEKALGER